MVAFLRPERRLDESIAMAEELGFEVIAAPSLDITLGDPVKISAEMGRIRQECYDTVVFTSPTSVEECMDYIGSMTFDAVDTVSIGEATHHSLAGIGIDARMSHTYSSEGIVDMLSDSVHGKRVLLIRSDKGSDILRDGLTAAGAVVTELTAYRLSPCAKTEMHAQLVKAGMGGMVDWFVFTSPLTAGAFMDIAYSIVGEEDARGMLMRSKVAAIGRPTASELERMGVRVDAIPENATFRDTLLTI